jgi:PleD family two-component response regulator
MDADDWVQQADAALYRAKLGGRDRFVAAAPVDASVR